MSVGEDAALLVVDVQRDFLPGGALPVPNGGVLIEPLNAIAARFVSAGLPVVVTRDWHPPGHCSFREQGGPWPSHCVQGTLGAELDPRFKVPSSAILVSKATSKDKEAYSAFDGTGLGPRLRALGVRRVFIGGIATEYCVLNSARDALLLGFETFVLENAIGAINARPGDGEQALEEMRGIGVRMIQSTEIPSPEKRLAS